MGRPVRFNIHEKSTRDWGINQASMPEGHMGEGFFATSFDKVVGLARKNSIWPLPFATSCCGIEFMATMASTYDLGRFGAEDWASHPVSATFSWSWAPSPRRWDPSSARYTCRWPSRAG